MTNNTIKQFKYINMINMHSNILLDRIICIY